MKIEVLIAAGVVVAAALYIMNERARRAEANRFVQQQLTFSGNYTDPYGPYQGLILYGAAGTHGTP